MAQTSGWPTLRIAASVLMRELAEQLDSHQPAADHDEREQSTTTAMVRLDVRPSVVSIRAVGAAGTDASVCCRSPISLDVMGEPSVTDAFLPERGVACGRHTATTMATTCPGAQAAP